MSANTLYRQLQDAELPATGHILKSMAADGTFQGFLILWGTSSPAAADQPAPSAIFLNTSTALIYRNSGTLASPTWTLISGVE